MSWGPRKSGVSLLRPNRTEIVRDIPQDAAVLRFSFGDDSYDDWQLRIRFVLHHGEFATLGSVKINEKIRFQSMVLLGVPIV